MTQMAPAVIETLDFETLLADTRARIVDLWPAASTTIELESDPINILAQAFAYRELLYRARVNDAAAAQYIETAQGADLDHKADFYGLIRLPGETDERLRQRLRAAIAGLAGNGTAGAYEARALAAHIGVKAARAWQPAPGSVSVVIWPADGHDSAAVLQAVHDALTHDSARVLGVPLAITLARAVPVTVRAAIIRDASAPADLIERLQAHLAKSLGNWPIGRTLPRSWVSAQLYHSGVAAVTFDGPTDPPDLLRLAPDQYVQLTAAHLTDGGTA